MYLYICDNYIGDKKGRARTDELVMKSLEAFLAKDEISERIRSLTIGDRTENLGKDAKEAIERKIIECVEILRTEKGKPYFTGLPQGIDIQFSVSHTKDLWVCLMSVGSAPVGVDVQVMRSYNYEKIAARYYTDFELEYVRAAGVDGFFEIWTRKEAAAKILGLGLGGYLKELPTMSGGYGPFDFELDMPNGENKVKKIYFKTIDLGDGIKCACCTEKEGELWIRRI